MIEAPLRITPAPVTNIWCAPGGSIVRIRPIEVTDAGLIREFVQSLSLETRYLRFMYGVKELSSKMIDRLTRVDHRRDAALIALVNIGGSAGTAKFASFA